MSPPHSLQNLFLDSPHVLANRGSSSVPSVVLSQLPRRKERKSLISEENQDPPLVESIPPNQKDCEWEKGSWLKENMGPLAENRVPSATCLEAIHECPLQPFHELPDCPTSHDFFCSLSPYSWFPEKLSLGISLILCSLPLPPKL